MASKIILFCLITFLSISLTSCTFMGNAGTFDVDVIENYRTGSNSLELYFIRNNPPVEIIEDSIFSIGVEVQNTGATFVQDAVLSLNYDSDYLSLMSPKSKLISLDGKNPMNPEGEIRNYFFDVKSLFLDPESSKRTLPLLILACYPYQTILTEVICLGRTYDDNYDSGDDVCVVRDHTYWGQGSPVVVESVKLNIMSTGSEGLVKPVFDIFISHNGRGMVTNPENYGKLCSGTYGYSGEMGIIRITEALLSDYPLSCSGKEYSLKDNAVRIRCESLREVNAYAMPFTTPLSLVIDFGYMQSESFKMDLIR